MKKKYTNKDIDRVFTQIKNLPEYFQIEKVPQILNNPVTKIGLPSHSWNTLNFIVSVLSVVIIVAIFVFRQKNQVRIDPLVETEISGKINPIIHKNRNFPHPDTNRNIHVNNVLDSSKEELTKVGVAIDSTIPEDKNLDQNIKNEKICEQVLSDSSVGKFIINNPEVVIQPELFEDTIKLYENNTSNFLKSETTNNAILVINEEEYDVNKYKQNQINKNINVRVEKKRLTIYFDTSQNCFMVDKLQVSINSYNFFKDVIWKYEIDFHHSNDFYLCFNFISDKKLNPGNYKISHSKINDMPFFSFYGSLNIDKKQTKFQEGKVRIVQVGSKYQVMFYLVTERGEKITGHYKGKLEFTKYNY